MKIREPYLPSGWYPGKKAEIADFLKPFPLKHFPVRDASAPAVNTVAAPHAGWHYSGTLAAMALSSLDPDTETIAVIGGHLPRGRPFLAAAEDGVKTPLGTMMMDNELREELGKHAPFQSDQYQDNTVETLLPMVHFYFPNIRLLWLRFPADISSFDAGKSLYKSAETLGRRLSVIASADLTHYGANFSFSPKGSGKTALDWVRDVNDRALIDAVISDDPALVLRRAEEDRSTCSAGAILGAMGFASRPDSQGCPQKARLLDYRTSADTAPMNNIPDSFVGYAAMLWE